MTLMARVPAVKDLLLFFQRCPQPPVFTSDQIRRIQSSVARIFNFFVSQQRVSWDGWDLVMTVSLAGTWDHLELPNRQFEGVCIYAAFLVQRWLGIHHPRLLLRLA